MVGGTLSTFYECDCHQILVVFSIGDVVFETGCHQIHIQSKRESDTIAVSPNGLVRLPDRTGKKETAPPPHKDGGLRGAQKRSESQWGWQDSQQGLSVTSAGDGDDSIDGVGYPTTLLPLSGSVAVLLQL